MSESNDTISDQSNAELQRSVKSGMDLVVFAVVTTIVMLVTCGVLCVKYWWFSN